MKKIILFMTLLIITTLIGCNLSTTEITTLDFPTTGELSTTID